MTLITTLFWRMRENIKIYTYIYEIHHEDVNGVVL